MNKGINTGIRLRQVIFLFTFGVVLALSLLKHNYICMLLDWLDLLVKYVALREKIRSQSTSTDQTPTMGNCVERMVVSGSVPFWQRSYELNMWQVLESTSSSRFPPGKKMIIFSGSVATLLQGEQLITC